jgi:alcohol dehydrogenase
MTTTIQPTTTLGAAFGAQKTMRALVYLGPGKKALEERPVPVITAATDAIVRVTQDDDLRNRPAHPQGRRPDLRAGADSRSRRGIGTVDQVGAGRHQFKVGDRVLISCISSCGKCEYCRRGMYSHCTTGGWILGNEIDGTQAEYVRIPHADTSLYPIPAGADEEALVMLSDILPTASNAAFSTARLQPGGTRRDRRRRADRLGRAAHRAVLFAGEIIAIDLDDNRLAVAKRFGATSVDQQQRRQSGREGHEADRRSRRRYRDRGGRRAAPTFLLCQDIVAPGGTISPTSACTARKSICTSSAWDRKTSRSRRASSIPSAPRCCSRPSGRGRSIRSAN